MEQKKAIAIYNTEKKELMAVFCSGRVCDNYIFPVGSKAKERGYSHVYCNQSLKTGKTLYPFKVAFRFANEEQRKWLAGKVFVIKSEYVLPDSEKRMINYLEGNKMVAANKNFL